MQFFKKEGELMQIKDTQTRSDRLIVTLVVKDAQQFTNDLKLNRTALQRFCYLAKLGGANLTSSFQIYYYGPYSDDISDVVDSLVDDEIIVDVSPHRSKSADYRLGQSSDELLTQLDEEQDNDAAVVHGIVEAVGRLGASSLDVLSTMHFIDRRLFATGTGVDSRKDAVITEYRNLRRGSSANTDLDRAFEEMLRLGLLAGSARAKRELAFV